MTKLENIKAGILCILAIFVLMLLIKAAKTLIQSEVQDENIRNFTNHQGGQTY